MTRLWTGVASFCLALLLTEVTLNAQDVPYPTLPKNAGKIEEGAPKKFTATGSGLKYRILRKGTGAMPKASNTSNSSVSVRFIISGR